jgi:hypothetical protein
MARVVKTTHIYIRDPKTGRFIKHKPTKGKRKVTKTDGTGPKKNSPTIVKKSS